MLGSNVMLVMEVQNNSNTSIDSCHGPEGVLIIDNEEDKYLGDTSKHCKVDDGCNIEAGNLVDEGLNLEYLDDGKTGLSFLLDSLFDRKFHYRKRLILAFFFFCPRSEVYVLFHYFLP